MIEKVIMLTIVYIGFLAYDLPKVIKGNRYLRIVYGSLMLIIFYLSFVYMLELPWPTLDELFTFVFLKLGQTIVDSVKVKA